MTLHVGDRVTRPRFLNDREATPRHGTITEVYRSVPSAVGTSHVLFAVRWEDTDLVERGYLENGLTPEKS